MLLLVFFTLQDSGYVFFPELSLPLFVKLSGRAVLYPATRSSTVVCLVYVSY